MKKLTEKDVLIEVIPHEEHDHYSYFHSDDQNLVKAFDDMVNQYGLWGFCCVEIKVSWYIGFKTSVFLGHCSYKDEKDFIENSGYYGDLVKEAINDLNTEIERKYKLIKPLFE